MPIYDFKCQECGEIIEQMLSRAPNAGEVHDYCPKCDKVTTQDKMVSKRTSFRGNFR